MELDKKIESILFFKGEPVKINTLAKILGVKENEISEAIETLKNNLSNRGIVLMEKENEIYLATAPENSELIEKLVKEDLSKDLGKAGLETLSIVLYRGPISRREVDYIRGVNSQFILRNLSARGLVERIQNPNDSRSYLYKATFELLAFLGIKNIQELPEYDSVKAEVEAAEQALNLKEEGSEE